jgi:hypothetical protein
MQLIKDRKMDIFLSQSRAIGIVNHQIVGPSVSFHSMIVALVRAAKSVIELGIIATISTVPFADISRILRPSHVETCLLRLGTLNYLINSPKPF